MRRVYIAVICLSCVMCCVFGVLFVKDFLADSPTASASTVDSVATPVREDEEKDVQLAQNESTVLALTKPDEAALTQWKSDDEAVVSVDSGGRIDARKQGSTDVTAEFSDGHRYIYHITVNEVKSAPAVDKFSTAYTANQDILQRNLKSKSDRLPYQLNVNRKQNCVTVYTYDENGEYTVPVRAMVCSCGKNNATITGEYNIYFHTEWHPLVNSVFGQYTSGFSGDFLFHSVPYEDLSKDTLEVEEYNKLGTAASKGCVRLSVSDSRWVSENCSEGTVVKIFDDDGALPLGKPEAIRITDKTCGWDPTDRDKDNPYNKKYPQITGAKDITIHAGDDYKMTDGVTAQDTCGNDVTDKMQVIGNVVPTRAGSYKVKYTVTDVLHRSAEREITVTVKE